MSRRGCYDTEQTDQSVQLFRAREESFLLPKAIFDLQVYLLPNNI